VSSIASIWLLDISLSNTDEEDPKDAWNEVLNSETPVESKGWLPPLKCVLLFPTELGHGVGDLSYTAHSNLSVPLSKCEA